MRSSQDIVPEDTYSHPNDVYYPPLTAQPSPEQNISSCWRDYYIISTLRLITNPYQECNYNVSIDKQACHLQLDFKRFSIGSGDKSGCLGDFLQVGPDHRFCGDLSGTRHLIPVHDHDSLSFETHQKDQQKWPGYEVRVSTVPCYQSEWRPIQTSKPPYNPVITDSTPRPPFISTTRPNYRPKPHYHAPKPRHPKSYFFHKLTTLPFVGEWVKSILQAKSDAINFFLGQNLHKPHYGHKPPYGHKPHYRPHKKPSYKPL